MEEIDLDKEIQYALDFARKCLLEGGTVVPMAVGITPNGERTVISLTWDNEEAEIYLVSKIKAGFKEMGVAGFVYVSDIKKTGITETFEVTAMKFDERVSIAVPFVRKENVIEFQKEQRTKTNVWYDLLWGDLFIDPTMN